jgi:hydrogenase nickel incorporation protein HypA/HybF
MHEMALCESILGVLEAEAKRQAFARVKGVWLEIGPFSGVEPEAMKFCFDAVTRGTLAENATIAIIETRGTAFCLDCAREVEVAERFSPCPDCGRHQLQITGGEELRIKELEVS